MVIGTSSSCRTAVLNTNSASCSCSTTLKTTGLSAVCLHPKGVFGAFALLCPLRTPSVLISASTFCWAVVRSRLSLRLFGGVAFSRAAACAAVGFHPGGVLFTLSNARPVEAGFRRVLTCPLRRTGVCGNLGSAGCCTAGRATIGFHPVGVVFTFSSRSPVGTLVKAVDTFQAG